MYVIAKNNTFSIIFIIYIRLHYESALAYYY